MTAQPLDTIPVLRFEPTQDGNQVQLQIFELDPPSMTVDFLRNQFSLTQYRSYCLMEDALSEALVLFRKYKAALAQDPELEGQAVAVIVAEKKDALVRVELSDDKLQCALHIETAYGGVNPNADQLRIALNENGVIKGVDGAKLISLANRLSNLAAGTKLKETVAWGTAAGQSKQAKIDMLISPLQDRLMKPQLRQDGTVDMYDFGEIEIVAPGDQLARRTPPVLGESGYDVLGKTLHALTPEDRQLNLGDGTELSPTDKNLLIASRKGVPLKIHDGVEVAEAYCVKDVDLTTGNIDFDGTVVVQGSVRAGMSVKASKKVMIRDYIESAEVIAGTDLVIGKGILGHKLEHSSKPGLSEKANETLYSANIQCGGDFFAAYVQYAKVLVGQHCAVSKHILHSHIRARSIELDSPKKSEAKIMGGLLQPLQSLICNTLGGPSYITTIVDFSSRFSEQLQQLKKVNEELEERINVVRGMNTALRDIENKDSCNDASEQVRKISNTIEHFKRIIDELKQTRKSLVSEIEAGRAELEICVKRNLYPGVEIQYVDKLIPIKVEKNSCKIMAKDDGLAFFAL